MKTFNITVAAFLMIFALSSLALAQDAKLDTEQQRQYLLQLTAVPEDSKLILYQDLDAVDMSSKLHSPRFWNNSKNIEKNIAKYRADLKKFQTQQAEAIRQSETQVADAQRPGQASSLSSARR